MKKYLYVTMVFVISLLFIKPAYNQDVIVNPRPYYYGPSIDIETPRFGIQIGPYYGYPGHYGYPAPWYNYRGPEFRYSPYSYHKYYSPYNKYRSPNKKGNRKNGR